MCIFVSGHRDGWKDALQGAGHKDCKEHHRTWDNTALVSSIMCLRCP